LSFFALVPLNVYSIVLGVASKGTDPSSIAAVMKNILDPVQIILSTPAYLVSAFGVIAEVFAMVAVYDSFLKNAFKKDEGQRAVEKPVSAPERKFRKTTGKK
jgi:hypothetical protein